MCALLLAYGYLWACCACQDRYRSLCVLLKSDAASVLWDITNSLEKNEPWLMSDFQDSSQPLVWFIRCNTPPSVNCVCIYLCKSESSATASIRWIWAGFTTHSRRFCPEATALRWVPPSFIYAFNYAFLFFFFSSPSAPIASETRRGKFNSFLEPGLYWVYWVRVTHTNIFFSCLSLISSSWQQQRHCMMPVL